MIKPKATIAPPLQKSKGEPPNEASNNLDKPADNNLAPMSFQVPASFKKEFKIFATERDLKMVDLLQLCFQFYKENAK
jgi:hypothetical protein